MPNVHTGAREHDAIERRKLRLGIERLDTTNLTPRIARELHAVENNRCHDGYAFARLPFDFAGFTGFAALAVRGFTFLPAAFFFAA